MAFALIVIDVVVLGASPLNAASTQRSMKGHVPQRNYDPPPYSVPAGPPNSPPNPVYPSAPPYDQAPPPPCQPPPPQPAPAAGPAVASGPVTNVTQQTTAPIIMPMMMPQPQAAPAPAAAPACPNIVVNTNAAGGGGGGGGGASAGGCQMGLITCPYCKMGFIIEQRNRWVFWFCFTLMIIFPFLMPLICCLLCCTSLAREDACTVCRYRSGFHLF